MFVVLGASGNTGKVVAETLLSQKRNVRVVVRDAAKGRAWKEAIEAAGVPHVVMLSSIGAQQPHGTGPVLGLCDAEATFTRGRAAATFVRAAYFMENWSGALFAVAQGVLPTFLCRQGDSLGRDTGHGYRRRTPACRGR